MNQVRTIIESLLFVSEVPLSLAKIKSILSMYTHVEIIEALEQLRQEYAGDGHGFSLAEVAQGYQFRSKPEYGEWIRKLKRITPARLSQPALETLAIIAYFAAWMWAVYFGCFWKKSLSKSWAARMFLGAPSSTEPPRGFWRFSV
jgi:chromosome segregation and condensation protein ScpB